MRYIALEEHWLPRDVAVAAGIDPASLVGLEQELDDVSDIRLPAMDEAGVDVQVLSVPNADIQQLGADRVTALSRQLNDRLHAVVTSHPDRFRAFASLPMCDPTAAAEELTRAVQELGCLGALVAGPTNGVFLDHPSMAPVLATAERLHVPIYLHPAPPPRAVFEAYFSGLQPPVAAVLATAGWGWHAETGLHVLRMVASGVFDRHPELQIIVGHMGENLPFSLARANERLSHVTGLSRSVAEIIHDHVWVTTCGYTTAAPLLCAVMVLGSDRLMFSVDYPFSDCGEAVRFIADAPLSPADREKIAHGNAERLFGL